MSETNHKAVAVVEKQKPPQRVNPLAMVQDAVERGLDPDTIRQLMDLADRHAATEARQAYTKALVDLKRDLPTVIARDTTVDFRSQKGRVHYTHASLASVMDAITGPLTQHGFSISWTPTTSSDQVSVTCNLTHSQGHTESTTLTAPVDKSGSKSIAQGTASTITLLQRYSALALLGIATKDMQDPRGETPPDAINTDRNMRAVSHFISEGYTKEDAEGLVSKPVAEWTEADLGILREWIRKRKAKECPTA